MNFVHYFHLHFSRNSLLSDFFCEARNSLFSDFGSSIWSLPTLYLRGEVPSHPYLRGEGPSTLYLIDDASYNLVFIGAGLQEVDPYVCL